MFLTLPSSVKSEPTVEGQIESAEYKIRDFEDVLAGFSQDIPPHLSRQILEISNSIQRIKQTTAKEAENAISKPSTSVLSRFEIKIMERIASSAQSMKLPEPAVVVSTARKLKDEKSQIRSRRLEELREKTVKMIEESDKSEAFMLKQMQTLNQSADPGQAPVLQQVLRIKSDAEYRRKQLQDLKWKLANEICISKVKSQFSSSPVEEILTETREETVDAPTSALTQLCDTIQDTFDELSSFCRVLEHRYDSIESSLTETSNKFDQIAQKQQSISVDKVDDKAVEISEKYDRMLLDSLSTATSDLLSVTSSKAASSYEELKADLQNLRARIEEWEKSPKL